jgi:transcriptional regulator of met regulon
VRNQARRLLGAGNSEMTCFFELHASKGDETP